MYVQSSNSNSTSRFIFLFEYCLQSWIRFANVQLDGYGSRNGRVVCTLVFMMSPLRSLGSRPGQCRKLNFFMLTLFCLWCLSRPTKQDPSKFSWICCIRCLFYYFRLFVISLGINLVTKCFVKFSLSSNLQFKMFITF